jgi:hypothetical protein
MYCAGLSLQLLSSFEDHDGFDGVMIGMPGSYYHFEFTRHRVDPVKPTPTPEDLFVIYVPDPEDWNQACGQMKAAGFAQVSSFNPYWEISGRTFEDADGYRIVVERSGWRVNGAV